MTTTATKHPDWCTAHTGHDDGSDDWHQSETIDTSHGLILYLTDGTLSGNVELAVCGVVPDTITLDQALDLADKILRLVRQGKGMAESSALTESRDAHQAEVAARS